MSTFLFIIILVLLGVSVPLTAIFLDSSLGKAIGKYVNALTEEKIKERQLSGNSNFSQELRAQREMLEELREENRKLEEKYEFLERLLEAPEKE